MQEQKRIWVTLSTRNLWGWVCAAAQSVIKYHTDDSVFMVLLDGKEDVDLKSFPGKVITVEELGIPKLEVLRFKYGVAEIATAVRPWVHQYILKNTDTDMVVYFDHDLFFLNSLETIFKKIEGSNIAFCPTTLSDYPRDEKSPDATSYRLAGLYNGGFLIVRRSTESDQFLDWWKEWLKDHCYYSVEKGFFVDQRFLDIVPLFFKGVHVIRDEGCNVAYWNLHERNVTKTNEGWCCNKDPLYFFHWSGFKIDQIKNLSCFNDTRRSANSQPDIFLLAQEYLEELERFRVRQYESIEYQFSKFTNGVKIQNKFRYYCVEHLEVLQDTIDPFGSDRLIEKQKRWYFIYRIVQRLQNMLNKFSSGILRWCVR